uniref:Uncharacterized protein n=1 Tax=Tanacetum cinerariifolium TaxID=118510 RepID=A0A699J544_TANCI|nr:hypothetical protein [Tanacetum cinerariifolium]
MVGPVVDEIIEPIVEMEEQEVNEEWLMATVTSPPMPVVPPPSTYEVGGLSTATAKGQSFTLLALGFRVSDAEVADDIAIWEIDSRVSAVEGQVIMGEPLSPDRMFDFPMDKPKPHPAYDFFAPRPLPGRADGGPLVDEIVEPIVEVEEQVIPLVIDMDEDIAMLFGDGDFSDDDSEGFKDEDEVWEVNEEWLMAPITPPLMPVVPPPSTYETWTAYTEGDTGGAESTYYGPKGRGDFQIKLAGEGIIGSCIAERFTDSAAAEIIAAEFCALCAMCF